MNTATATVMRSAARIVLLLAALGLLACSISDELTESERALLITEADFRVLGLKTASVSGGKYQRTTNLLDKSRELKYEFQQEGFFLASIVKLDSSATYSFMSEKGQKFGLLIGLRATGVTEEPIELRAKYGGQASLTLLIKDGRPIGNAFTATVGNKSFVLAYAGVYFDDADGFDRFIGARIDAILKSDPAK